MLKIALVSMPFGSISSPSLALTMLKGVVDRSFTGRVTTTIGYLTFDFAELLGLSAYRELSIETGGVEQTGDWFFRQAAFPDASDNTNEYLARFFPAHDARGRTIREAIDCHRSKLDSYLDMLIRQHGLHQADVVGLTTLVLQRSANIALARRLKRIRPDITIVMGGARCSFPAASALVENVSCIDFVFSGPSLVSFHRFVAQCLEKEMDRCRTIPGVFSRASHEAGKEAGGEDDADKMPTGRPAEFGEECDMEVYPELDYDEFMQRYKRFTTTVRRDMLAFLPFTTSEGCWWNRCSFCARNGCNSRFRSMSPEKAVGQFNRLFRYSAPHVVMASDNAIPPTYLRDVFPHLDTPQGMTLQYNVRPNQLAERDFEVISAARANLLFAGIESFSSASLKNMNKGTTAFDNITFLKCCRQYDIGVVWQLIMGMPGEGADIYEKYIHDFPRLHHLQAPYDHLPVILTKGSQLYEEAIHRNADLRPVDSYEMIYPFPRQSIRSLAFCFKDHTRNAEYVAVRDRYWALVEEQVYAWRMRWARGQYGMYSEQQGRKAAAPLLVFVPGSDGVVVYDSRQDTPVERPLSSLQVRILESLSTAKRASDLVEEIGLSADVDIDGEMETLLEWGLVFEEDGTYLSLVIGSHASWDQMTTRELVFSLQALDLQLWTEEGRLKYKAAPGVLTEDLRRELSNRRDAIAARLRESETLSKEAHRVGAAFLGNVIK